MRSFGILSALGKWQKKNPKQIEQQTFDQTKEKEGTKDSNEQKVRLWHLRPLGLHPSTGSGISPNSHHSESATSMDALATSTGCSRLSLRVLCSSGLIRSVLVNDPYASAILAEAVLLNSIYVSDQVAGSCFNRRLESTFSEISPPAPLQYIRGQHHNIPKPPQAGLHERYDAIVKI